MSRSYSVTRDRLFERNGLISQAHYIAQSRLYHHLHVLVQKLVSHFYSEESRCICRQGTHHCCRELDVSIYRT